MMCKGNEHMVLTCMLMHLLSAGLIADQPIDEQLVPVGDEVLAPDEAAGHSSDGVMTDSTTATTATKQTTLELLQCRIANFH